MCVCASEGFLVDVCVAQVVNCVVKYSVNDVIKHSACSDVRVTGASGAGHRVVMLMCC